MIKNQAQFKDTIEEREFQFFCDNDAPTNLAKEFLFRCLKWIGQIEDAAKFQKEQTEKEQPQKIEPLQEKNLND